MPVLKSQIERVKAMLREQSGILTRVRTLSVRSSARIRAKILRGGDIRDAFRAETRRIIPATADAMFVGHLIGHHRAEKDTPRHKIKKQIQFASALFRESVKFAKRITTLTPSELQELAGKYKLQAINSSQILADQSTERVLTEMARIQQKGLHVGEAKKQLAAALDRAGYGVKSNTIETLARTQTKMAYDAGRWQQNQDPVIQEILWGYIYVNPDDDRSRPTHAALDGTTLPKDHPLWAEIWPPNGYNCRCTTIELFEPHKTVNPMANNETVRVSGTKEVRIGADPGWNFNAGVRFKPETPIAKLVTKKAVAKTTVRKKAAPKKKKAVPKAKTEKLSTSFDDSNVRLKTKKAWKESLTKQERSAFESFTARDYEQVRWIDSGANASISKSGKAPWLGQSGTARFEEINKAMHAAASRAPVQKTQTVYRGLGIQKKALLDQWQEGKEVSIKAWTSTSRSKAVAENLGTTSNFPVVLNLEIKRGLDIASISATKAEKEVLLARGQKFKVKRVVDEPIPDDPGFFRRQIFLEEID